MSDLYLQGTKLGEHRASVFVLGMPVIDPGVTFKVRRPGALEEDVMSKFRTISVVQIALKETISQTD